MEKMICGNRKHLGDLPKTAGVYVFYGTGSPARAGKEEILYIGKAINLRDRVKSHFQQPSYRDTLFIAKVERVCCVPTDSEIAALILEAGLIKKHQPRFNVVWRDDKNYFYVALSNPAKPYLSVTHQKTAPHTEYLGPFVEGGALKKTLKYLRRVFPYYTSPKHPKNPCAWCHLGVCPGPDPDLKEYKKNIKKLALILRGKRNAVLESLNKEMRRLAKGKEFEKAAAARDKLLALERVMLHTHVIERNATGNGWIRSEALLRELLQRETPVLRMECYDISNIQGTLAVGSMVVFAEGKPNKGHYRKFRIRMENAPNDIAMLKEVITRRLNNPQWPYPEVMLIDGGIAQLNAAIHVKNSMPEAKEIKVISIAKGRQELFIEGRKEPIALKQLPQEIYNLVKHMDDEAHRFAITYHKKLRKKSLLP